MRRILVGVDGSTYAEAAVRAVADLFGDRGEVRVTLLTVIRVVALATGVIEEPGSPGNPESWAYFEEPRKILRHVGIEPTLLLREGDPAEEIVAAARQGGFDLIVVGHRGISTIKALVLGSVSQGVVAHAPCSVLVVRPESAG